MTKKSFVCVWMGCNKNLCFCIDVIKESKIKKMVKQLGGNPEEELCEKSINETDEEHEKTVGTFMEPEPPKDVDVDYKIYKIKPYDFDLKVENCQCMKNYGETVYFIEKGKYTVKEIVSWVQAVQI